MTYGCDFIHPFTFKLFLGSYIFKATHPSHHLHRQWDIYCWPACSGASAWKGMKGWIRNLRTSWGRWKNSLMGQKRWFIFIILWAVQRLCNSKVMLKVRDQMKVILAQNAYVLWGRIKAHSQLPSSRTGQGSCLAGTHWRASGDTLQKLIYRFPSSLFSAFACSILRRMGVIIST